MAVGGAPVGLKKRHAGSLQTEVEHVEVGDRGMKKPGAGVRGGVQRGGSLSCWTDRGGDTHAPRAIRKSIDRAKGIARFLNAGNQL